MSRHPNANHWQLIETTFRAIAGRSWRRAAARCLGVEPSDLRSTYDRVYLPDDLIDDMHVRIKVAAASRQKVAEAEVLRIHAALVNVEITQDIRLRDLQRLAEDRAIGDPENAVNRMTAAFIADMMLDEEDTR